MRTGDRRPENIDPEKYKKNEAEEFSPDVEVCSLCEHILDDNEDTCLCKEEYELEEDLDWASFLGCDDGASEEEINQAFEDQMT